MIIWRYSHGRFWLYSSISAAFNSFTGSNLVVRNPRFSTLFFLLPRFLMQALYNLLQHFIGLVQPVFCKYVDGSPVERFQNGRALIILLQQVLIFIMPVIVKQNTQAIGGV